MTPTMLGGLSERDVRDAWAQADAESGETLGRWYWAHKFAAALWSRFQRSQPDVEAVKREAVRDFITTIDDAYGPEWAGRTIGQEPIAWHWFRLKYPDTPPVREPRVTEAEYRAARQAVESIHGPDYPVPLADILYAAAKVRLAAGGTDGQ